MVSLASRLEGRLAGAVAAVAARPITERKAKAFMSMVENLD